MLLDAGGDREDVRVEDDVGRVEADLLGQQLVGALADRDLARDGVGLALLVEGHDDDAGAVAAHGARLVEEVGLAFLQADRVDDRLALHALEAGLETDHFELSIMTGTRAISGSVAMRFRNVRHRLLGVEHALVHVDVEDVGAAAHLLERDLERRRGSRPLLIRSRELRASR